MGYDVRHVADACRSGRYVVQPRRGGRGGGGFTLVEILVVVAIIVLLLSILMPSLSRAKEYAQAARCRAHLQQLGFAHVTYATGNGGRLPGQNGIVDMTASSYQPVGILATLPVETGHLWTSGAMQVRKTWQCPSARLKSPFEWYRMVGAYNGTRNDPWTYHFTYNYRAMIVPESDDKAPGQSGWDRMVAQEDDDYRGCRKLATLPNLARTILLGEENTGWLNPDDMANTQWTKQCINDTRFKDPDVSEPRHLGHSQVGYLDGHADQIPALVNLSTRQFDEYWPKAQP